MDKTRDWLAEIEGMADAAALADESRLAEVAAQIGWPDEGELPNLPQIEQKIVAIGRLADRGHPPEEIAQSLCVPIGEVELLIGLRRT